VSGQPRPEDELTVTTASSGISAPASVGEMTATFFTWSLLGAIQQLARSIY